MFDRSSLLSPFSFPLSMFLKKFYSEAHYYLKIQPPPTCSMRGFVVSMR